METALQLLAFGLFLGFLIFMLDGGGDKIVKVIDRHLTGMRENNASQSQVAELQRQLKEQELTFYRFKSTTEGKLAELSQQLQYLEKEK